MKFEFEVDNDRIGFKFNKFWGSVAISVNGKVRLRDFRMYSRQLVASWEFKIPRHHIRIDKIRPLYFSGFRSNTYKVYIDGRLHREYKD